MIDHQNTTAVDDDAENLLTPHQFVKKLKSEYHENYNRKFAFEKAEFHQCIPNPMIPGGFITVQLMSRTITVCNHQPKKD